MSQQEYEPQKEQSGAQGEEIDRLHYPYAWSAKRQERSMPRDEPPIHADARREQSNFQRYQARKISRATQVPSWARPQRHAGNSLAFVLTLMLLLLLLLALGGLGFVGAIVGVLLHILGVLLGAVFVLLLVLFLGAMLLFVMVRQTIRRVFHLSKRRGSRMRW